jgi:hypothetical protein
MIPFLGFNFGNKPPMYERIVGFFVHYPFGCIKVLSDDYVILMLTLNGIFWSILIIKVIPYIRKWNPNYKI